MQVNIYQAKAQLSALLEMALDGKEVIIAKAGKPVAKLIPMGARSENRSGVRLGGLKNEKLRLAKDFHEPSKDEDLLAS